MFVLYFGKKEDIVRTFLIAHTMEVNGVQSYLFPSVLQNIFCVPLKKEMSRCFA